MISPRFFDDLFADFGGDFHIFFQSGDHPGPQMIQYRGLQIKTGHGIKMSTFLFKNVVMFRRRYLRAQEELDNVLGCFDCLRDQKFHFRTSRTTKNKSNRSKTQNVHFFFVCWTQQEATLRTGSILIKYQIPQKSTCGGELKSGKNLIFGHFNTFGVPKNKGFL